MTFDLQTCDVSSKLSVFVFGFVTFVNYHDVVGHVLEVLSLRGDHAKAR